MTPACECPVGSKHGRTVRCGAAPVTRWEVPAYKRRPRHQEWRCDRHIPRRGVQTEAVAVPCETGYTYTVYR